MGVKEKYIVVHLLEAVEILESNLSLKKIKGSKRIKAVHGASLPREFERQDMKSIFNKKTHFPILFKRAVEIHMLKIRGHI